MDPLAVVPLIAALLLRRTALWLGSRLPPRATTRLLTSAGVVTAVSCGFVLAALAFDALAQLPALAARGQWSAEQVHSTVPLPPAVGWPVAAVVAVLLSASVLRLFGVGRDLTASQLACRALGPGAAGLVIIDDERPDAYTLPGWRGRIVVSTAMLAALPPAEQRVLLAHEHSHLQHRHHLYVQLAELAGAANPLLRPLTPAVAGAVERWADEDAAQQVGSRRTAARALARASLASLASEHAPDSALGPPRSVAIGAVRGRAGDRVRALLAPAPRRHLTLRAAVVVLTAVTAASALGLARHTEVQFEQARQSYAATQHLVR